MANNYFGITDPGKLRSNNEDTFIAQPVLNKRFIAACVIDGVGGYEGGEVAASLAHGAILNALHSEKGDIITILKQALSVANEAIYKEKQVSKINRQMACVLTLALADLANNKFFYAHVGDTRLYLLRDNSLVKVTHDHSFVGFLEDSGRLTEEAAMRHPKRNEINKALGFDAQIITGDYIETGESPFLPGDVILLCSDGLTDMVDNSTITAVLQTNKNLSFKGKALINAANDAGGKDNITVVLVQNNKPPLKHTATKPAMTFKEYDDTNNNEKLSEGKNTSDLPLDVKNKRKKKSGIVPLFSFLGLLILAALIWLLYQNYDNQGQEKEVTNTLTAKKRNDQEQLLIDSINGTKTNEVFVLNQQGGPTIVLTDSIPINKDSLHIIGNGVTIESDTTYKGPAFTLSPTCKYILLDSLILENFNIGVLAKSQSLHLKSVQFKNCRVPVKQEFIFTDTMNVNGKFADTPAEDSEVIPQ